MSDFNEKEKDENKEASDRFPRSCLLLLLLPFFLPFLFHGFHDFMDAITRVRINKEFTIEYFDVVHEKCLYNGRQNFVCDPKIVYWNKDSLLISDGDQCFLIEFGKRIDKEDMEEIPCENLRKGLWHQPVEVWRKN